MKLLTDERVKHRLVGLTVIVSIALIFVPAIMKKSSQRFEEKVRMSVKLPAKPQFPRVVEADKKQVLGRVALAKADVDVHPLDNQPVLNIAQAVPMPAKATVETPTETAAPIPVKIARATPTLYPEIKQPVTGKIIAKPASVVASVKPGLSQKTPKAVVKPIVKKVALTPASKVKTQAYAVQLASFSNKNNATQLVEKLKKHGYSPKIHAVKVKEGNVYKVVVGQAKGRYQADALRDKLKSQTQIKGFIVTTEVS